MQAVSPRLLGPARFRLVSQSGLWSEMRQSGGKVGVRCPGFSQIPETNGVCVSCVSNYDTVVYLETIRL